METIALILLPVAVLMCAYALTVFIWRARAIQKKQARTCCQPHVPAKGIPCTKAELPCTQCFLEAVSSQHA